MNPSTLAAVGSTFLAVLMVAGGIWYAFLRDSGRVADRLGNLNPKESYGGDSSLLSVTRAAGRLSTDKNAAAAATLRRQLHQAGFRNRDAPTIFAALRTFLLFFLGLLGLLLGWGSRIPIPLLTMMLGATGGYYLPVIYISNIIQKRQVILLRGFPDALDLLVSCVEAGLGLDIAFRRVADETVISAPELAKELQLVTAEVQAGVPRADALRHLSDRTGLEEIQAFVNVLIQAERFGTSVAQALRTYAEHMRIRRMQKAEEKAAQVSPKLTIIMILFILPCLMVVLMAPALIRVKNMFAERNHGGP
jgi:tight adherence protein C